MENKEEEYEVIFKLVLVGDAGVGKTHLLSRYVKGKVPKTDAPTIGLDFVTKNVKLNEGQNIKLQMWDTAGQERYRSISTSQYRRAVGALLVYDITKEKTFNSVTKWMEDLQQQADPDIVIMLVGNKLDKAQESPTDRQVEFSDAQEFAQENKLLFAEASALSNINVNDIFEQLLSEICKVQGKQDKPYNKMLIQADQSMKPKDEENCQC